MVGEEVRGLVWENFIAARSMHYDLELATVHRASLVSELSLEANIHTPGYGVNKLNPSLKQWKKRKPCAGQVASLSLNDRAGNYNEQFSPLLLPQFRQKTGSYHLFFNTRVY